MPFLGASPTTSASILVEFGGNDWAAGCVVAHVFSHMYISPAVRHTPHARDLLFSITVHARPPILWLGTQGFDHKAPRLRQGRIPDLESLPRLPLTDAHCAGYECLVQEIAQLRFHGCARISSNECKYVCMHALSLTALWLSKIGCRSKFDCRSIEQSRSQENQGASCATATSASMVAQPATTAALSAGCRDRDQDRDRDRDRDRIRDRDRVW